MKILSFSSCFPSSAWPTEGIFVLNRLAAMAKEASVAVEVVHPIASCPAIGPRSDRRQTPQKETIRSLTVHHLRFHYLPGLLKPLDGWLYFRGLLRRVRQICLSGPPDLLDAHFAWPDGVGVSLLARQLETPYTITLRGTINPRYRKNRFRSQLSRALREAAAVISLSKPMALIAAELGACPSRIHVIPNGVDTSLFRPADKDAAKRRLGLAPSRRLLVCVASLKRAKGQEELLRALPRVGGKVRLVLIGAKADKEGYLRRLRSLTRRVEPAGEVTFLGNVGRKTVADYLIAADLSVLPSHSEGCPNSVLESLACGTPVVATRVGALPELVRDGKTGLLVRPGDPEALGEAIRNALARTWRTDVIRRSVANRSWAAVGKRVIKVFRIVLGEGVSHRRFDLKMPSEKPPRRSGLRNLSDRSTTPFFRR